MNMARLQTFLTMAGFCIFASGCTFFDPKLYATCEDALKKRLQSPSGYQRISINSHEEGVTLAEYEKNILTPLTAKERESFDRGKASPTRHMLFIEFDAPNVYGTLVRGLAKCEYVSLYGDPQYASMQNVRINGMTNSEWLLSQIE